MALKSNASFLSIQDKMKCSVHDGKISSAGMAAARTDNFVIKPKSVRKEEPSKEKRSYQAGSGS
ncbi:hypothetical protein [Methylosarcina fibrata]|uniref:hypothetical protein n=1 Tax=Methylosarcina fibrata TaxID=105972 RepID=UPI0012FB34D2|nr:hypothetical protein [Methylosarcina fibrata]